MGWDISFMSAGPLTCRWAKRDIFLPRFKYIIIYNYGVGLSRQPIKTNVLGVYGGRGGECSLSVPIPNFRHTGVVTTSAHKCSDLCSIFHHTDVSWLGCSIGPYLTHMALWLTCPRKRAAEHNHLIWNARPSQCRQALRTTSETRVCRVQGCKIYQLLTGRAMHYSSTFAKSIERPHGCKISACLWRKFWT